MAQQARRRRPLIDSVIAHLEQASKEVFKRRNKQSAGVDGITLNQYSINWRRRKPKLCEELRSGDYRFSPIRPVAIRKDRSKPLLVGNIRPISIPVIEDRVVQRAILHAIWTSVRDCIYNENSFGGIRRYHIRGKADTLIASPSKGVRDAIKRIVDLRSKGFGHVFETDILSFYPSIDRVRLTNRLLDLLPDESLNAVLIQAIETEVANTNLSESIRELWDSSTGVAQGGVLSPLFANLYLADFDTEMRSQGFSLVRYVDDLVVLCESEHRADEAYRSTEELLENLGLRIHPLGELDAKGRIKTRLCSPSQPFDFLGVSVCQQSLLPADSKWRDLRTKIDDLTNIGATHDRTLVEVVQSTNRLLKGWMSAFAFCNFRESVLEEKIDQVVRGRIAAWMLRLGLRRDKEALNKASAKKLGIVAATAHEIRPILDPGAASD